MLISGVQPFTIIDYPEHIACIIFTAGCNFRCGYCHNPEFVLPEKIRQIRSSFIKDETVVNFLKKRKNLLDGVVISGGEPTMQADLERFIEQVKSLGLKVKLDTNGNNPLVLQKLIERNLLDYIAMDFKTSLLSYKKICGTNAQSSFIEQSLKLIKASGISFEIRTTLIKEIHTRAVLLQMAEILQGIDVLFLQKYRPQKTLSAEYEKCKPFDAHDLTEVVELFKDFGISCQIR